jgi:uncharacterized membrane protein YgaE (UPF0421/DUF939 family)
VWPIAQCAVAAGLAWLVAQRGLGHPVPFFAAVAAVVSLGVSFNQRLRRVGELAVGVAIGVAVGDLFVNLVGRGPWQLVVTVMIGMAAAQLLDGGPLLTSQAALQAVFVVTLPAPAGGVVTRWEDAVVGGAVALVVAAAAPPDPRRAAVAHARDLLATVAEVLLDTARAIRTSDAPLADAALDRIRRTQMDLDRWEDAIRAGEEISRISPLRRRARPDLIRYRLALEEVDHAVRNLRVAVRRAAYELDIGQDLPAPLAEVLDDLALALQLFRAELALHPGAAGADGAATAALVTLAPRLDPGRLCADSLSATVVVAQLRSAVVDLLGAQGMTPERARGLLP